MNFLDYKEAFDSFMGVKSEPDDHEKALIERAKRYIEKIAWIPGLRMIAIVNSLSMYATHKDSDIDLFVITKRNHIWIVRALMTGIFWILGVWRHNNDISGNFCLSFFIEEDAMDMSAIAIEDDIYLYYWGYYMKPILALPYTWQQFRLINNFPHIPLSQDTLGPKEYPEYVSRCLSLLNALIRILGEWKAYRSWVRKGKPEGVIITKNILKFHDKDRRREIRDRVLSDTLIEKSL